MDLLMVGRSMAQFHRVYTPDGSGRCFEWQTILCPVHVSQQTRFHISSRPDSVRKRCDQIVNERAKKKVFTNDLSIELETVHITDDFGTHRRPNAGIRPYTCIRHKSKSLCRTLVPGRKMEEQQRQQAQHYCGPVSNRRKKNAQHTEEK